MTLGSRIITGARIVTPGGVLDDGWVHLLDARIAGVGSGRVPPGERLDLDGGWLVPGFVDLHMHGGGGYDASASADEMAAAVAFHRSRGTAATLVSLVTAPVEDLLARLATVADLAERGPTPEGHVLGCHLEGPFLSAERRGAQNADHLRTPDLGLVRELVAAARGHLRVLTIAPELPGALAMIAALVDAGVVVAIGHTDATYAQTRAAFDRGASLATHLYNGMRPVHHREPGPVLAALDAGVACEVINDGVHVHPAVLREVLARGGDRPVLVTDAIAAAGAPDGEYDLGGQPVEVRDGIVRLAGTGGLAGSTLTMDAALRRAVDDGVPIDLAVRAASANPARVLDVHGFYGGITPGLEAVLVHLDDSLHLRSVLG